MTRDEYLEVLAAEPVTPGQRGAIMREFARLGIGDRAERLGICAALLGLGGLGSTADLGMGQAGQLVNVLQKTRNRAELPDRTPAPVHSDGQDGAHDFNGQERGNRITVVDAICRILAMIAAGLQWENAVQWHATRADGDRTTGSAELCMGFFDYGDRAGWAVKVVNSAWRRNNKRPEGRQICRVITRPCAG